MTDTTPGKQKPPELTTKGPRSECGGLRVGPRYLIPSWRGDFRSPPLVASNGPKDTYKAGVTATAVVPHHVAARLWSRGRWVSPTKASRRAI